MKTSDRTISKEIEKLLNEQIKKELESGYLYFQIAAYFEKNGLPGFAGWFKVQSKEELEHAKRIYDYLMENNADVTFYEIQPGAIDFHYLEDPLQKALSHEKFITDSINVIYMQADSEKDFRTQNFLDWFIKEQLEEEVNARNLLERFKVFEKTQDECCLDSCSCVLYELDRKCSERK